jgi:hypothetical protein
VNTETPAGAIRRAFSNDAVGHVDPEARLGDLAGMDNVDGPPRPPVKGENQAAVPAWVAREDALAQRENREGQAQGNHFLWVLVFAALMLVWGYAR